MKYAIARLFFVLTGALLLASCSGQPFAPGSIFTNPSPPYPAKEIFVTEGSVNNRYITLGPVEYTLRSDFPMFSGQLQLRNQAIDYLKQEAAARYGAKVDAIIDIEIQESAGQGYFSPSFTYARGIAIAFNSKEKPYAKPKRKHKVKSTKNSPGKAKPSNKTIPEEPEEPEITPSELLK